MPTAVTDPFGTTIQACSISTAVKAKFSKEKFSSEAAWAKHVKADAFNTLRQKIKNGEVSTGTVVGRTASGQKLVYKGKKVNGQHFLEQGKSGSSGGVMRELDHFEDSLAFTNNDWDFGPNMAKMVDAQKASVNSPAQLQEWIDKNDNTIQLGDTVATVKYVDGTGGPWNVKYDDWDDVLGPQYKMEGSYGTELMDSTGLEYYSKSPNYQVDYKVGQVDAPAHGLPVASTSTSKGTLTNEDAATMFVKTKDKLAQEAGINIKGASGKLDDLVYQTIAKETGYTAAEMLAKVEAYKGSGKKLSALKKKVLPKTGNPSKVATEKAVNSATASVKATPVKPVEVPQVWDEEAVAKAYIKAKDHVVANNNHGWTLYTKNPDFDAEIHKWMQADLGMIPKANADTAVANYIANTQKLSVLKKQMIKKGELTPQADTLKAKKAPVEAKTQPSVKVDSAASLEDWMAKNPDKWDENTVLVEFESVLGGNNKYKVKFGKNADGEPALLMYKNGSHLPSGQINSIADLKSKQDQPDLWNNFDYKVGQAPKVVTKKTVPAPTSPKELFEYLEKYPPDIGSTVATMNNSFGSVAELKYLGLNAKGKPLVKVGGSTYDAKHLDMIAKANGYDVDYVVAKPAPAKTGGGEVGKASQNPTVIEPSKALTPDQQHDVFLQWEGLNLPISSHGSKIHSEALALAKKFGLGDDVLPILRAVDAGKTKKFGLEPSDNKFLYETKTKEWLKDPQQPYTPPAYVPPAPQIAETFGELPVDSEQFKLISPGEMGEMSKASMVQPTARQQSALSAYSGSYYHEVNDALRAGKDISHSTRSSDIQKSMQPLPAPITVRRGTSVQGLGLNSIEDVKGAVGKTFVEPGFSSTAVGGSGQFSGQVNLVIQAPKGTKAVWLKPYSGFQTENELLLAAGTKFKILKVETVAGNWGSMNTIVHVRVVP